VENRATSTAQVWHVKDSSEISVQLHNVTHRACQPARQGGGFSRPDLNRWPASSNRQERATGV
jgi:hypothetical protein